MVDKIRVRTGANRGDIDVDKALFHDNGDGSFDLSVAAHLRGWDTTDLVWKKVTADHNTGALSSIGGGGLVPVSFDSIYYTATSATIDTYVYKQSGVTVATLTVTYTDATHDVLVSAVRT